MTEATAPVGLAFAEEGNDIQAVALKIKEHECVLVVEPGHDSDVMWAEFTEFLAGEGLT